MLKTLTLSLCAAAVVASSACTIDVHGSSTGATVHEQKRIALTGTPNLTVRTFNGSVDVRTWDRHEILVDIEKSASTLKDAEDIRVDTSQEGGAVRIEARNPERHGLINFGWSRSPSVRLILSVPRELSVDVRTGDGAIGVGDIVGHVQLHSGDGPIRLDGAAGDINVTTGDGAVTALGVQGTVAVTTGDGSVEMSGRFETLRARTGDGAIAIDALPGSAMKGGWTVSTGDGGVRIRLPQAFDADVHAQTGDGAITTTGVEVLTPPSPGDGEGERRNIRGRIGKGGEMLTVRTGDGAIDVVAR